MKLLAAPALEAAGAAALCAGVAAGQCVLVLRLAAKAPAATASAPA